MTEEDIDRLIEVSIEWEGLAGIQNTKDNVLRKAAVLADEITHLASKIVKDLNQFVIDELEIKIDDDKCWTLYYDLLLFMIHLSDREAFQYLMKDKRKKFMVQLFKEAIRYCCEDFEDKSQHKEFEKKFQYAHEIFQKEYALYKRGKTEYLTDNLEYNFTKRILGRLGEENNIELLLTIFSAIVKVDILLNLPKLLDDTKSR